MARPVFLYGTLLDPRALARCSGDPRLPRTMRPATLHGFARVGLGALPYPTLVRRTGASVAGVLIRPAGAAMASLSAYEGRCYRLRPVRVTARRGPVLARAWMTPVRMALDVPWPSGVRPPVVRPSRPLR